MQPQPPHKTMRSKIHSLFGSRQVHFRGTSKPITPFGGLISLVEFFGKIRLTNAIQEFMPFRLSSPNSIPPAHTLLAFFFSAIVGASRFAHTDWLRADKALHAMLGIPRFPGTDTIRNLFSRFTQGAIESFWRPLWRWLLPHFAAPHEGFSLDLDSTIFQRSGRQQGAAKGYNPQRPGRKSHHPLLAVLGEAQCVLHAWLRAGNTSASRGISHFLREALALLPAGWKLRTVRADSGFFSEELLEFLEERGLTYIVVARLSSYVRRKAVGLRQWIHIDENYAVSEFEAQLFGWKKPRRFVVVRELVRDTKEAVGRKLLDVPGYTFRIFVTNRVEDALVLWRDYNQRAIIEQRIEELKAELNADGFCMKQFFATEAAFLSVLFVFNLLSLYQKALNPQTPYRQPATLRSTVFLGGAALGRVGRTPVLHISSAWGGFEKHYPLVEAILKWVIPISPKLPPTTDVGEEVCTI
ncbi:MAG: IS1380 family transposase [Verrucomicrobiota bacterium]